MTPQEILAKLIERERPESGNDVLDDFVVGELYALIQCNGGRAPNERWITTHGSLDALSEYVAEDDEWHPISIVDLATGEEFVPVVTVTLGERVRTIE